MYYIIENKDQLNKLELSEEAFIQIITSNDNYHPKLSRLSLVYYNNYKKGYIFVINHSEGFSLDVKLIESFLQNHNKIYLIDKKLHSYFLDLPNSIDVEFIRLDKNNEIKSYECSTIFHNHFYSKYSGVAIINELIPISKHYEKCECLYKLVKNYFDLETSVDLQNKLIDAYKNIENNGIRVDLELFKQKYTLNNFKYSLVDDTIYSYYNLYNLTSRPTNSFNGLNFLAIPKDVEYRKCIIPRNDYLVEFDFDAYHLRLISNLINFDIPKESMHTYLGRAYFAKNELSNEEYKESKAITFKQLYGGVDEKYKHIEFFQALNNYINSKWKDYNIQKAIVLPTGRILKKLPGMNKLKLFNYIIQNLETKENIYKIIKINELLKNKKSKLILITYDSFLFDFSKDDSNELLKQIKNILEENNMIIKYKYGVNYAF